jgi:hypothetical protein
VAGDLVAKRFAEYAQVPGFPAPHKEGRGPHTHLRPRGCPALREASWRGCTWPGARGGGPAIL